MKREEMLQMERPPSSHIPMDRERRAKQFAPFQALRGFGHSIAEKGKFYERKKFQSDEQRLEIDRSLAELKDGESIRIMYYMESQSKPGFGTYLTVEGVPKLFPHLRILSIEGLEILFDDVVGMELLEDEEK